MPQVESSMGRSDTPFVTVTILGLKETRDMLAKYRVTLLDKQQQFLEQAANTTRVEVVESIIGNRGEPKSVDTGNFANSISVMPLGPNIIAVYTDISYAQFLEYGTSRMQPRAHFQNTAFRVQPFLKDMGVAFVQQAEPSRNGGMGITIG